MTQDNLHPFEMPGFVDDWSLSFGDRVRNALKADTAEAFERNTLARRGSTAARDYLTQVSPRDLYHVFISAFSWGYSSEGHDFWADLVERTVEANYKKVNIL